MGFEGCDITSDEKFVENLGYQLEVVPTNIAKSFLMYVKKSRPVLYAQSFAVESYIIAQVSWGAKKSL